MVLRSHSVPPPSVLPLLHMHFAAVPRSCHRSSQRFRSFMIPDHFLSTDRRSCRKWNFLLRPWCFYHAAFISFHMTGCSLHHKPDTIDQTHLYLRLCGRSLYCSPRQYRLRKCRLWYAGTAPRQFRQNDLCRLLRDKFRFRLWRMSMRGSAL